MAAADLPFDLPPLWEDEDHDAYEPPSQTNGAAPGYPAPTKEQRDRARTSTPRQDPWSRLVTPVPPEWTNEPPPNRAWLLRDRRTPTCAGVLPLGKAGQVIGEGGGSKTMAMIQLAVAVATGTDWLGTFSVADPGRVLLVLGEEDREEVQRRVYSATRRLRVPLARDAIVTLPLAGEPCSFIERGANGNGAETAFLRWLRTLIKASAWKLIVLDPLSRFAGPDAERDNAQGTRFVQVVESLSAISGATALATHHTNQPSRAQGARLDSTSGRGSTALVDGFRWSAGFKVHIADVEGQETRLHLRKTVEFSHNKSNYSQEFEPLMLRRDLEHGGVLLPLGAEDAQFVTKPDEGAAKRAREAAAKQSEQQAREVTEDRAVLEAVTRNPGLSTSKLIPKIRALVGACGQERAEVAIARVAPFLDVTKGSRNADLHSPTTDPAKLARLPAHLRPSRPS
jgi:hypothetical protein